MTRTCGLIAEGNGFTLIELLVVISILAMLVVAFVPDAVGVEEGARITETRGRCLLLSTAINDSRRGFLPPDDLIDREGVQAAAWQGAEGTVRKYQLVSAGRDQTFNTEDDIVWPERN